MVTDFLFEVNQWIDLNWKQVTGSGPNSWLIPGESVIDIVVWTISSTTGQKAPHGENSWVPVIKKRRTEKFSLALLSIERHTWKYYRWKRIEMTNSLTVNPRLSSQMKKPGEKKKREKTKIHPKLMKFYMANKHRTVTLRKMKLKRPSSGQFKQTKWKKGKKREEKRKTFMKSLTR